jgi:hypothetical protein
MDENRCSGPVKRPCNFSAQSTPPSGDEDGFAGKRGWHFLTHTARIHNLPGL